MAIKRFSWNFVGWVDLEDVGFDGIPIDDRIHTPEYLATPFKTIEELALCMDPLGYDALYSTEHHFQPEGIEVFPNLHLLWVHLAQMTRNLRYGCAFNIAPQWNPLRLAEDYAMSDIMTRGRVIFGVGRGSQTREMETLGAPMLDQAKNRDLFEEQVEIVLRAFHDDEFSYRGKFYDIPPKIRYRSKDMESITLVPRPLYSKEIWQPIASGAPRGLEFMAKNGIKGILAALNLKVEVDPIVEAYMQFAAKHGRTLDLGEDLGVYMYCHLGDTRKSAIAEIEKFQEESFKRTAGIGGNPTDPRIAAERDTFRLDQLNRLGDRRTARAAAQEMGYRSLDARSRDDNHYLFGPASKLIDTLKEIEERYPALETIILHPPELTYKSIMLDQIQRFAEEVLPAFPDAIQKNRTWPEKLAEPQNITRYLRQPAQAPTPAG
jgi:alkanesulfonate monooxygenase SsuD/methylene tetrahydromethanopterin reductase-like flavin-dependent oxidoreductase (luciferase family)